MRHPATFLAWLASTISPSLAFANVTPIVADLSADWTHQKTAILFPASVGGFSRTAIDDFGTTQFDIAATYDADSTGTTATVYLFRAGLVDASIWHDRILTVMSNGRLGKGDQAAAKTTAFRSSASASASGWRSVMPLTGGKLISTGVAIFPRDEWLISVRMSSSKLNVDQLDAKLAAFADALALTREKTPANAAYLISVCPDTLPAKKAERDKPDMMAALLSGTITQLAEKDGKIEPVKDEALPPHYCRDDKSTAAYGIYRAGPPKDGYVIAYSDAGVAAFVTPDSLGQLVRKLRKNSYTLSLISADMRADYAGFIGLPPVEQALQALNGDRPISSSGRDGNTTIFAPASK